MFDLPSLRVILSDFHPETSWGELFLGRIDLPQNLARSSLRVVSSQHAAEWGLLMYISRNTIVCCDLLVVLIADVMNTNR
jgi:hypothetical protein